MHITYSMVQEDMPGIIDFHGGREFTYTTLPGMGGTCQYVWKGKPSCLIGCYLVDLGLPMEAFKDVEGKGVDTLFFDGHLEKYGFTADTEAVYAMNKLQNFQDDSYSWGDAYDYTFDSTDEI